VQNGEFIKDFVIVTGVSGAGKSSALRSLEDMGFFCIDNLPIAFIHQYLQQEKAIRSKNFRLAIDIDSRDENFFKLFEKEILKIKKSFPQLRILYLTASNAALIRRFSETRRPHPLSQGKDLLSAIRSEKKKHEKIYALADSILDTTDLNIHILEQALVEIFQLHQESPRFPLSVLSFGYRYGIPLQCDLVFDVRFLPNPYFIPVLKNLNGRQRKVQNFVLGRKETKVFIQHLKKLLDFLIPKYIQEGKSYLTLGFGCTGGKHRSVSLAEYFKKYFETKKYWVHLDHRDVYKK